MRHGATSSRPSINTYESTKQTGIDLSTAVALAQNTAEQSQKHERLRDAAEGAPAGAIQPCSQKRVTKAMGYLTLRSISLIAIHRGGDAIDGIEQRQGQ
jgi:hypothetical protein